MNINYLYISFVVIPILILFILYQNNSLSLVFKIFNSVLNTIKKIFIMFVKLLLNVTKYSFKIIIFVIACIYSIGVAIFTLGNVLINPKVPYDTLDLYLEAFFSMIIKFFKCIDIAIDYIKKFINSGLSLADYIISLQKKQQHNPNQTLDAKHTLDLLKTKHII